MDFLECNRFPFFHFFLYLDSYLYIFIDSVHILSKNFIFLREQTGLAVAL
jgi:hypothetical protein